MTWQDKAIEETKGTQFGCILLAALGRGADSDGRRFDAKAQITSDGFVMCGFRDARGVHHNGAFVGSASDLFRNVEGLSKHLGLTKGQLANTINGWIDRDWRS